VGGSGFKIKDMRTWQGTVTAIREVKTIKDCCTTASAFKKAQLQVAKKVSAQLHNTPSIALASYIDPAVFAPLRGKML
jgi:DNA topoisomerase IB